MVTDASRLALPPRRWPDAGDAELLTADRASSEHVHAYSTEDAERGRDEPCTCGSGRK